MRFELVIVMVFFGIVFMADGSNIRNFNSPNIRLPTRPRTIRGYKPKYMSTAVGVGFGKRNGYSEFSNSDSREKFLVSPLHNVPQGLSTEWILREIKTNPVLASRLMEMLINDENDQTPMGEQFQPEGPLIVF